MDGKRHLISLAVLILALLTFPTTIQAGTNLGLQLTSSPGQATICDNNVNYPGCTGNASDLNPALGAITFIGAVGNWTMNVTSGFGPPMEQLTPLLDISSFNATAAAGAGPMTVLLSVSGMTSPNGFQQFMNMIGGTNSYAATIITTQAWYSANNTPFCVSTSCGVAIGSVLTVTGGAFSGESSGSAILGSGPYAITLEVTINTGGNADTTSFDDSLLPEPTTLSLLGSGLFGFGMAFRKMLLRA